MIIEAIKLLESFEIVNIKKNLGFACHQYDKRSESNLNDKIYK